MSTGGTTTGEQPTIPLPLSPGEINNLNLQRKIDNFDQRLQDPEGVLLRAIAGEVMFDLDLKPHQVIKPSRTIISVVTKLSMEYVRLIRGES